MTNSIPSKNYRKSKLNEIKKINDLNLEDSTKQSLVRKALKDVLSDPKIQEVQDEKRNKKKEEIAMQKLVKQSEYNRLLSLSDTINESFDEFDNRTNNQISVLKEQEARLTAKERQLCGEGFLPSDIYQAQQDYMKNIFDKDNNIDERIEKTNCIFDFEDPKQKYIIANVDGKKVIISLPQISYHKELYEKLKYLYPNQTIKIKGGGHIHIDPLKKEIYIFGSSKDYKYEGFDIVAFYVLEKQYPGYIIKNLGNTINVGIDYGSERYKNIEILKSIINGEKVELNIKNVMLGLVRGESRYLIYKIPEYRKLVMDFFIENIGTINQSLFDDFSKQYNLDKITIDPKDISEDGSIAARTIFSYLFGGDREIELFIGYLIKKVKENTGLNYFSLNIPLEKREKFQFSDKEYTLNYNNPGDFNQYVPSNTTTKSDIDDIKNERYSRIGHHH